MQKEVPAVLGYADFLKSSERPLSCEWVCRSSGTFRVLLTKKEHLLSVTVFGPLREELPSMICLKKIVLFHIDLRLTKRLLLEVN